MSTLVKSKFYWDKEKYKNTKDIEDAELELLNLLQKIAFSLQCLQKVGITNTEFQQLTTSTERELLKYSGVWLKDELGEWYFEHNNFREYLTAEYLVNMPIETIKNLITYHDDRTKSKSLGKMFCHFWLYHIKIQNYWTGYRKQILLLLLSLKLHE